MVRPSSVFSSLLYLASCLPVHLGLPVPWWLPCGDHLNPKSLSLLFSLAPFRDTLCPSCREEVYLWNQVPVLPP